jgi:hypothetical protein
MLKNFGLFFLTFLLVIGFKFAFLGFFGDLTLLTALLIISLFLPLQIINEKMKIRWQVVLIVSLSLIGFIFSLFTIVINAFLSNELIFLGLKSFIFPLAGYSLILAYYRRFKNLGAKYLTSHLFLVIGIHSLIMLAMFLSDPFRDFIYGISAVSEKTEHIGNFRIAGFSGGGGALLSIFQAQGLILSIILFQEKYLSKTLIILIDILILVSIFLSGRTGLFIIMMLAPIIMSILFSLRGILNFLLSPNLLITILVIFLATGVIIISISENKLNLFIESNVTRMFSTFSSQTDRNTFAILFSSIYVPEMSLINWIFGTSTTGRIPGFYYATDIGYLRLLYSSGIIGSILLYSIPLFMLIYSFIKRNYNSYFKISFIFSLIFFITHFKEFLLFARHIYIYNLLLFFAASIELHKYYGHNKNIN